MTKIVLRTVDGDTYAGELIDSDEEGFTLLEVNLVSSSHNSVNPFPSQIQNGKNYKGRMMFNRENVIWHYTETD